MAITTYGGLIEAVEGWLVNDDIESDIPTFIGLAEARFNREIRNRKMLDTTTMQGVITDSLIPLPDDFVELASLNVTASNARANLQYVPLHRLRELRLANASGVPRVYSIAGTNIEVSPPPDDPNYPYEAWYYKKIPALGPAVDSTNWLLTDAPDVYFYGTLLESAPYLEDDERIPVWTTYFDRAVTSLRNADRRAQYSPRSSMISRLGGWEGRRTYPGVR